MSYAIFPGHRVLRPYARFAYGFGDVASASAQARVAYEQGKADASNKIMDAVRTASPDAAKAVDAVRNMASNPAIGEAVKQGPMMGAYYDGLNSLAHGDVSLSSAKNIGIDALSSAAIASGAPGGFVSDISKLGKGQMSTSDFAVSAAKFGAGQFGIPPGSIDAITGILNGTLDAKTAVELAGNIAATAACASFGIPPIVPCGAIGSLVGDAVYAIGDAIVGAISSLFGGLSDADKAELARRALVKKQDTLVNYYAIQEAAILRNLLFTMAQQYNTQYGMGKAVPGGTLSPPSDTALTYGVTDADPVATARSNFVNAVFSAVPKDSVLNIPIVTRQMNEAAYPDLHDYAILGVQNSPAGGRFPGNMVCAGDVMHDVGVLECSLKQHMTLLQQTADQVGAKWGSVIARDLGIELHRQKLNQAIASSKNVYTIPGTPKVQVPKPIPVPLVVHTMAQMDQTRTRNAVLVGGGGAIAAGLIALFL